MTSSEVNVRGQTPWLVIRLTGAVAREEQGVVAQDRVVITPGKIVQVQQCL